MKGDGSLSRDNRGLFREDAWLYEMGWEGRALGGIRRCCTKEDYIGQLWGLEMQEVLGANRGTLQASRQFGSTRGYCATREAVDARLRPSLSVWAWAVRVI